jgi:hypothetical protein
VADVRAAEGDVRGGPEEFRGGEGEVGMKRTVCEEREKREKEG